MISLAAKWEQFLKRLANDHQIDFNTMSVNYATGLFPILKARNSLKTG
jgi:hypothetical protein